MNILITGVAGFIGSNLARELLKRNHRVIGLDNFSQGFPRNIEVLQENPQFTFLELDVLDQDLAHKLPESLGTIVHLAAYKIPRYGNALLTLKINMHGTENILEFAKTKKIKVVFASTSDIYGKNPDVPFHEESSSVIGSSKIKRWSYAVSKLFDEHLCLAYHEEFDIPVVILRYFGAYGPGQSPSWWGGPQAAFMQAILEEKPLEIHGDGKQTRSFTYITDTINGTIAAIEKSVAVGQIFNIGSTGELSILALAQKVWACADKPGEPPLEFKDYNSFKGKYEDVMRRIPDVTLAENILGFKAAKILEEGLRETFLWQKSLYQTK